MSKWTGEKLSFEIYGESHSEKIGVKVSGMPCTKVDFDLLGEFMQRRKASNNAWSTKRVESDEPKFTGLKNGDTVFGDFSIDIYNGNVRSSDYDDLYGKPRPSHADYGRYVKDGVLDYSGGGAFSGRMTAPLTALGGLCKQYLKEKYGVEIDAYLSQVGSVKGKSYKDSDITIDEISAKRDFPSLSRSEEMIAEIQRVSRDGDSVGGVIECSVYRLIAGLGNNLFDGLEGKLSTLLYGIPGVKGVEFGLGFNFGECYC
ncbi:MAG: chorismate synthase [Clostridia bacterium]|nr:chorismate synthase [Clostridia bacterium]